MGKQRVVDRFSRARAARVEPRSPDLSRASKPDEARRPVLVHRAPSETETPPAPVNAKREPTTAAQHVAKFPWNASRPDRPKVRHTAAGGTPPASIYTAPAARSTDRFAESSLGRFGADAASVPLGFFVIAGIVVALLFFLS